MSRPGRPASWTRPPSAPSPCASRVASTGSSAARPARGSWACSIPPASPWTFHAGERADPAVTVDGHHHRGRSPATGPTDGRWAGWHRPQRGEGTSSRSPSAPAAWRWWRSHGRAGHLSALIPVRWRVPRWEQRRWCGVRQPCCRRLPSPAMLGTVGRAWLGRARRKHGLRTPHHGLRPLHLTAPARTIFSNVTPPAEDPGPMMTPRQRLDAAFNLQEPDRTPILGGWIACPEHICALAGATLDGVLGGPLAGLDPRLQGARLGRPDRHLRAARARGLPLRGPRFLPEGAHRPLARRVLRAN